MRDYDSGFVSALAAARDQGLAPVWFLWVVARDRDTGDPEPLGFWSGDEDITLTVGLPDGSTDERSYLGGCGLSIAGIEYVADLTDTPVTATLSQIAPAAQELVRGLEARLAYCEIHCTVMTGRAFASAPQLQWVGILDDAPISTPQAGSDGAITLSIRSELMVMLGATNPAKSSDAHQKRRSAGDRFNEYAATIRSRSVQWFKG